MQKITVSTLTGQALTWAAAKAEGWIPAKLDKWKMGHPDPTVMHAKSYTNILGMTLKFSRFDYEDGNVIVNLLQKNLIAVEPDTYAYSPPDPNKKWWAKSRDGLNVSGPTAQIAITRCFVVMKLGHEIEIPKELLS